MLHDIIFLILGLALLVVGGNWVTDGSVTVARRFNISGLVIGLTVVAFGSSVPDLAVCLISTIQHKSELALGDVVGAGIFDMLLAVGLTSMIMPIVVRPDSLKGNLPLTLLAALVLFFAADTILIDGQPTDRLDRSCGLMMLCFFVIFIVYTVRSARTDAPRPEPATVQTQPQAQPKDATKGKMWLAAVMVVVGLGVLVLGGNWIVDGASGIARRAGMSEALVGLTIVAVGSSLPDAATSIIAAIKRQPGIALGNLIGCCIFDILFVLGICATIRPLDSGSVTFVDYATLVGAALILYLTALLNRRHTITRTAGAILASLYVLYIIGLVMR